MECYCAPLPPEKIVSDGEIFCAKCGKVFGRDDEPAISSMSKLSLFLRNSSGSPAKNRPKETKYLHITASDLNMVSDTCSKLTLPSHAQNEVWRAYQKLRQHYFSKPHSVAYPIYRVSKLNDIPTLEEDVIDAIKISFNVRRVPTYLIAVSAVHKRGITDANLRLFTDPHRVKSDRYYLLIYSKKACRKHPHVHHDILLSIAAPIYKVSQIPNLDTRAKRAVAQALAKLGVA